MRPVVPITPVGREMGATVNALVDSGCEHVLAAPWIARAVGVDAKASHREIRLGIGGESIPVRFVDLTLRLHPPGGDDSEFVDWQAEVGFCEHWRPTWPMLVGQVGFFDRFTVTLSRQAQQVVVEDWDSFDKRFGALHLTS